MEVSRNCMRALRRHLHNMGSQGWTDMSAEMVYSMEEQVVSSSLCAANAIRFASTAPTAQASEPIAQAATPAPPPPSPSAQGQGGYKVPWRSQNTPPMQRRVSQHVMGLQHKMHSLLHEEKFKEAVTFFENFVNDGFREAKAQKLEVGQLPIQKRPAEYQWLQYMQALNRSQNFAKSTISEAIKLMIQVGITPRAAHYQLVLYHLRRQSNSSRALAVIDQMIRSGVRPTLICYEHAIFAALSNKDLDGTSMLLDSTFRTPSWRLSDIKRGQMLYTKVVVYCAQLKRIENALVFMKQMQDLQMRIPVHLFLDVVSNAAEADDCSAVYSILSDLEKIQSVVKVDGRSVFLPIKLDEGLMVNVLNCAARYGETVLADKAWDILNTSLRLPYFHEIRAEIEYHAEAADDPQEEEEEAVPNTGASTESASGDVEQKPTPEKEEAVEAPPTKVDFSDVSSDWEEILRDKLHNDRVPMMSCYHAYIEAQAKGGQIEKAFDAVRQLEENYPDNEKALSASQGLSMLADELAKDANTVDQAFYLLDQWHSQGKSITTPMLDVVVAACSRMGDANRAFETFEAYARLGVKQRTDSYNVLMEVCAQNKQVEVIMKLVQEMTKAGVKPNVDTYMQIIEGYINNSDTSGITHALLITRREGFKPTLKILERAFGCADQQNDAQAKQAIKREMIEAGYRFSLQVRQRAPGGGGRGRGRGYNAGGGRGRSGTTYLGPRQSQNQNYQAERAAGGQFSASQLGPNNTQGAFGGDRSQGGYVSGYQGPVQGNYQTTSPPGGYQGGMQPGYQGGVQPGFQGGMQPGFQGGMQPGFQGGMQPGFRGMQSGYQGGMQPGYQGGVQPGYQGGMQPGYQGDMQPGYQGGSQAGNQGGVHFGYPGTRTGYQGSTEPMSAETQTTLGSPGTAQDSETIPSKATEVLRDPSVESRTTESGGQDPSPDVAESQVISQVEEATTSGSAEASLGGESPMSPS